MVGLARSGSIIRAAASDRHGSNFEMTINRLMISAAGMMFLFCNPILGPNWQLRRGVIQHYQFPIVFELSDTAVAGVPLTVNVATYGGGCVRRGFVEVKINGLTAELAPYDSVLVRATVCTLELYGYRHEVNLVFEQKGIATVRLVGREMPADKKIIVTRTVLVQ